MVSCRRMCLRPKLLPLDRGYMHPSLEAAVRGDTHVQGEEVVEGRRSNLRLHIAASCSTICHLSHGRLIPHAADLNLPCSSSPRPLERFSGCLADDGEGRIRSDGYSARKLETIAIDLLYQTCVATGNGHGTCFREEEMDHVREETRFDPLSDRQLFPFFPNCLVHIVHVFDACRRVAPGVCM